MFKWIRRILYKKLWLREARTVAEMQEHEKLIVKMLEANINDQNALRKSLKALTLTLDHNSKECSEQIARISQDIYDFAISSNENYQKLNLLKDELIKLHDKVTHQCKVLDNYIIKINFIDAVANSVDETYNDYLRPFHTDMELFEKEHILNNHIAVGNRLRKIDKRLDHLEKLLHGSSSRALPVSIRSDKN